MNKELIRKNFSRYAGYYDKYCSVQNLCALQLISKVAGREFNNILDIGCGTGNYTKLLRDRFPSARIKAIDISEDMIRIAGNKLRDEKTEFLVADAEAVDLSERFDLITSNACFQWFENLEGTLFKYKNLLNKNGLILFSVFGPSTFYELNASLKEIFEEGNLISSCGFLEKSRLSAILKRHFKGIAIEEQMLRQEHNSVSELLNKIRYTGARGFGANGRGFWTGEIINELQRVYSARFKYLTATYQVFYCRAMR